MRDPIKRHAPYLYLTQPNGQGLYQLFLAISVKAGYELVEGSNGTLPVQYLNGRTEIKIKLRKSGNNAEFIVNKYYPLDPGNTITLDADEILVTVTVLDGSNNLEEEFTAKLQYGDCDRQAPHVDAIANEIAYNCPYVYLAQVNNTVTEPLTFEPYLLLSPKGYSVHPDKIAITTPENGVCETIIVLSNIETNGSEGTFIHDFQINRVNYFESGKVEGNFRATVIMEDNIVEGQSLHKMELMEIHQVLAAMDTNFGNVNGGGTPAIGENGAAATNGARVQSDRKKSTAVTRNMSSERRAPSPMNVQNREESV
ncbi:MAG: hypothetical protein DHS20C18_44540 [Saprospiraceae bacterium]|nr:MAG: hypothetical protein DHS20C18_44540 [Saprospiraceae bacterium]